jgi:hypothetical protein
MNNTMMATAGSPETQAAMIQFLRLVLIALTKAITKNTNHPTTTATTIPAPAICPI